jgi:hypothetical protein
MKTISAKKRSVKTNQKRTKEVTYRDAVQVLNVVDKGLISGLGLPHPGQMCVEAAVCYALGLPHGDNPPCVTVSLRSLKIGLNDQKYGSPMTRARVLRRLAVAQLGTATAFNTVKFFERLQVWMVQVVLPRALQVVIDTMEIDQATPELNKQVCMLRKATQIPSAQRRDITAMLEKKYVRTSDYGHRSFLSGAIRLIEWMKEYYLDRALSKKAFNLAEVIAKACSLVPTTVRGRDLTPMGRQRAIDRNMAMHAEEIVQILIKCKAKGTRWLYLTEAAVKNSPASGGKVPRNAKS